MAMLRVQTYFPEPLVKKLDKRAEEKGIPRSEVVRRILEEHFDKEEKARD
jgi:metal-responsive CopG/Arc/MetJ family transcriptional regulator